MSGNQLIQLPERMARLSKGYVHAIASHSGIGADEPEVDHDSIDLVLSSSAGRKPKLDIQLKATTTIKNKTLLGPEFTYNLPIKNYNDLRIDCINPRILIVLCLPKDYDQWIDHSTDQLSIRKCGYWVSLKGKDEITNKKKVAVKIPTSNVFSPASLIKLMAKIEAGESL